MDLKRLNLALEIKSIDDKGTFEGIASKYDVLDLQGDIVRKGAFTKTLNESKEIPILWEHNSEEVIGLGTLTDTADGLLLKAQLDMDDPLAVKAHRKLIKGMKRGLSIGFSTVKDAVQKGAREILEAKLWEVSIVTFPANTSAVVTGVKSSSLPSDAADTKGTEPELHSVFSTPLPTWK